MDDISREQATAYFKSINIFLDLREKGKRNNEQKWMTASTVDDYMMGKQRDAKSKSPGVATNTLILCELVYGRMASSNQPPP
eukprot:6187513-Pleurochrysis_carterae.AAC.1